MPNVINPSKLITQVGDWHANMTELNNLGAAYKQKPHLVGMKMDQLFSGRNLYSDNPIYSQLIGSSSETTYPSHEYEWYLKGQRTKPMILRKTTDTVTAGKFNRSFTIVGDLNWFLPGDILVPGKGSKKYQCRVEKEVIRTPDGGFKYSLVLATDDPQLYVPAELLTVGNPWVKLYSQYGEGAEQDGSTHFSTDLAYKNRMSLFRKQYRITNFASTEVLQVAIPDSKGNYHKTWMNYAEVEYFQQWYRELERGSVYSRSYQSVKDATGRPVISGAGVQEQLEGGHIARMPHLTAKGVEEYLMDIYYGTVAPGKGRNVKGFTGEYGMVNFHNAVQDWMDKRGFIKNIETFAKKTSSPYHDNALETGFQLVKYHMKNGATLELHHMPLYDDKEINYQIDPSTGYPLESQRITFLDFTDQKGSDSNIQLVKRKDSEAFTYVEGLYGPYGPKNKGTSAHSGAYYSMHIEKTCGVKISDVSKCGEILPYGL